MSVKFEVYKSKRASTQPWYWRCRGRNGRIICASSDGYESPSSAIKTIRSFATQVVKGVPFAVPANIVVQKD